MHANCFQSCSIPWDPVDCSPPGSPLHGILQAKENWSGLHFPSPGDLPYPGIKPGSPVLHTNSLPSEPLEKAQEPVNVMTLPTKRK